MENLSCAEPFTRQQMYDALRKADSHLSYNSTGGVIVEMTASGEIERIGRNRYMITHHKRAQYKMIVSEQLEQVIMAITDRFPLVEFLTWDTLALNEFLNHQIAHSTIFVEVEAMLENAVFEYLREAYDGTLLYKPDLSSLNTYWKPDAIIVQKLTTQAPGDKSESHQPVLEKFIVDLFANKLLGVLFSQAELPSVLEQVFDRYVIDESKLFRYAKRRNCSERIRAFIKDRTSIVLRYE
jgi:hypothetical protein